MLVKTFVGVAASIFLISVAASPAAAQNVRWHHIIGIKQAGNMVGNIMGGGQPWSASGGHARVDLATGNMEFEVTLQGEAFFLVTLALSLRPVIHRM
jgi:hypothetical protein